MSNNQVKTMDEIFQLQYEQVMLETEHKIAEAKYKNQMECINFCTKIITDQVIIAATAMLVRGLK